MSSILDEEWFANTKPGYGNVYRKVGRRQLVHTITESDEMAVLMAKSPQLYRALKECREFLETLKQTTNVVADWDKADALSKKIDKLLKEVDDGIE